MRRFLNGRQVDADGRDLLTGGDPWALPHGCSWSSLETFIKNRAEYRIRHHVGTWSPQATPAMELGTLFHLCTLEHGKFRETVAIGPEFDRTTRVGKAATHPGPLVESSAKLNSKAWRDAKEANPDAYVVTPDEMTAAMEIRERIAEVEGKSIVTRSDYETVMAMRESVMSHAVARRILEKPGALFEREYTYMDESGLQISEHPDILWPGAGADLKSSRAIDMQSFTSSIARLGYARQAFDYLTGSHQEEYGEPGSEFFHIAVQSSFPYPVEVYCLADEWLEIGGRQTKRARWDLAECVASDDWRGPSERADRAIELTVPPWVTSNDIVYEEG